MILLSVIALQADDVKESSANLDSASKGIVAGDYPIYSSHFIGSPSPFHETVAALIAKGAILQPPGVAEKLWNQGRGESNIGNYRLPIYSGLAGQRTFKFSCVTFGTCGAAGLRIHLPESAAPSDDSDHHLIAFDKAIGGELDGWGGDGDPDHRCSVTDESVMCSWGGYFPFSGNGLDLNSGNSANNGGYAFGLFVVTAQEILQGHIDHALGMVTSCLDNPDIYPADTSKKTDTTCSGRTDRGNPQYGQLVHLKNSYTIASSAYSPECKTYLTALQKYGAYTFDTNNGWSMALASEDTTLYASPNPWYTKIFPEMVRYGDGTGSRRHFRFQSCLNRLNASDIELYDIAPGT